MFNETMSHFFLKVVEHMYYYMQILCIASYAHAVVPCTGVLREGQGQELPCVPL